MSSLNITGNIIGSGTALTNLNYNAILNPPSIISLNNPSTFISTLCVSGNTTFNGSTTHISTLNVSGITTLSGNTFHYGSLGINASSLITRLTLRMSYNDGNAGGFCIDSADATNTYNLRIFSYVQAGAQVGYNFQVNNIASSVNAITLNYNGSVNIGNYLTIAHITINEWLFNNTGGIHGDMNADFNNVGNFGYKFINWTTNSPSTHGAGIAQYYSWSMGLGSNYGFNQFVCQFAVLHQYQV